MSSRRTRTELPACDAADHPRFRGGCAYTLCFRYAALVQDGRRIVHFLIPRMGSDAVFCVAHTDISMD